MVSQPLALKLIRDANESDAKGKTKTKQSTSWRHHSATSEMTVNDACRLCKLSVRIKGYIGNSKLIFLKEANQKSVSERLAELGLTLLNVQVRSNRICLRCFRLILRLENALATFRGWQKAEEEPLSELSTSIASETSVSTTKPLSHLEHGADALTIVTRDSSKFILFHRAPLIVSYSMDWSGA